MPFKNTLEAALLDHILTDPTFTPATTLYIGLSSTASLDDGTNFTEPSGGSYARVATTAADWGAAVGGNPSTKTSTAAKTFPTATADWLTGSNLVEFGLFSASTAGTLHATGTLTVAKGVLNGDTPSFPSGSLVLKLGKPGDTF